MVRIANNHLIGTYGGLFFNRVQFPARRAASGVDLCSFALAMISASWRKRLRA
jgi:hypothetical protein